MVDIYVDCYLEHNLGDDLFLLALLDRYKDNADILFHVWADSSYRYLQSRYSNIHLHELPNVSGSLLQRQATRRKIMHQKMASVAYADAAVQIGGSIFMEWHGGNVRKRLRDYRYWLNWKKWTTYLYVTPSASFVIGSNFGPWKTKNFKRVMHRLFGRYCTDVCFRDQYSAGLFSDLRNVRWAPDVLFGVTMPHTDKRRQVFVSVIDLNRKGEGLVSKQTAYQAWLVKQIQLMAEQGYETVLCSFCEYEGDSQAVADLSEQLRSLGIGARELYYAGNDQEILSEIAASEYVIASRFHATILGLAAGCKVLPVLYSDKTRHVLEDLDYPMDTCVDLLDDSDVAFTHDVASSSVFPVTQTIYESNQQFEALDAWLNQTISREY